MLVITTNLTTPESAPALANFYSLKVKLNGVVICSLVNKDSCIKTFFKDKLKCENQQEAALANADQLLKQEQNSKELLWSVSCK